MRPHPPFVGRRSSEVAPRAAGGSVTALAFFDGWVIPTVKKGHAFRLGQGMGPTVAGVAPIRSHWGEDLRKTFHTSGRSSTLLEGFPEVFFTSATLLEGLGRPSPGGRPTVGRGLEDLGEDLRKTFQKCGRGRGD